MLEQQSLAKSATGHWYGIAKPFIFALAFWAVLALTWKAAMVFSQRSLTSLQLARATNLGELPKYREANAALKPDPNRVVFFGDSITYQWNITDANTSYVNRGIGGQTSGDMLVRFRQDVINLQPKTVVILAGVNDFGEHNLGGDENDEHKLANVEANDQTMAELAELHHIRPVFISLLPLHAYTPHGRIVYRAVPPAMIIATNRWLRQFCQQHSYPYIDAYSAMVDERGMLRREFSDDGIHPNSAGYEVMTRVFLAEYSNNHYL